MKTKDEIEIEILSKIFYEESIKIDKTEQPDFIITYDTGNIIGVEITELFYDGTSARLKNIDGYVKDIIQNENYRHKKDRENLEVHEIEYFPKDGSKSIETKVLFMPKYTLSDYRNSVLERLKDKNEKIENYNNSVEQRNLVIYDRENKLEKISLKDFNKSFFSRNIIDEIRKSNFDEIYFITTIDNKEYYYNTKAILLLNVASSLADFLRTQNLISKLVYLNLDFEDVFAETLLRYGYSDVRFDFYENTKIVYAGRYGIGLQFEGDSKWGFGIYDTYPLRISENFGKRYFLDEISVKFFNEKKFKKFEKAYENKIVSTMFAFETLK